MKRHPLRLTDEQIAQLHNDPAFWHTVSYMAIDITVQELIRERDAALRQVELDRATRESKQEATS